MIKTICLVPVHINYALRLLHISCTPTTFKNSKLLKSGFDRCPGDIGNMFELSKAKSRIFQAAGTPDSPLKQPMDQFLKKRGACG